MFVHSRTGAEGLNSALRFARPFANFSSSFLSDIQLIPNALPAFSLSLLSEATRCFDSRY